MPPFASLGPPSGGGRRGWARIAAAKSLPLFPDLSRGKEIGSAVPPERRLQVAQEELEALVRHLIGAIDNAPTIGGELIVAEQAAGGVPRALPTKTTRVESAEMP